MIDATNIFREEAAEHLATLEAALLELDEHPQDADQIALAFRAMHTIKGAAGMVGYDHLSYFTHHLETFFDAVRAGNISLSHELINMVLDAKDHIEALLDRPEPSNDLKVVSEARILRFAQACNWTSEQEISKDLRREVVESPAVEQLYRIDFTPEAMAFRDGFDFLTLIRELHALGRCHVSTFLDKRFDAEKFEPELCYIGVTVLLTTARSIDAISDVFFFVLDDWQIDIKPIHPDEASRLGDLLIEKGIVDPAELEKLFSSQPKSGELLEQSGLAPKEEVERALAEQAYIRAQQKPEPGGDQSIRVSQQKLDVLMDQVGELVILQARLEQLAVDSNDERIVSLAEELDRLVGGLRDTTFEMRMLPIGSTFGRFRRLVRDLSRELGKVVTFETEGADTELDKVVLDRLADPLIHILRNSLDHGIETPEQRQAKGKPAKGRLHLKASQHQGHIQITVSDDGAGLNADRIRAKALERGVIGPNDNLDEHAINQLIFEPGFSTAEKVSDVSGRGVGMDVVRRSIEGLQGWVQIDSKPDEGTVIRISLPMTLAIIEGLMVAVSGERYVLPLSAVEECIETRACEQSNDKGVRLIPHRDGLVPCLRLRECFGVEGQPVGIEQTVVVRVADDLIGVTVDEVIGHFQTVIKNLGRLYQGVQGVMGATIMGDGRIAMILDLPALVDEVNS